MSRSRIIGLVGRAGSGKDTVGNMITAHLGGWTIAFADPLKRFCKEVFDWSDEQLWGPSEKRTEPDPRYMRQCCTCEGKGWLTATDKAVTMGHPRLAHSLGPPWAYYVAANGTVFHEPSKPKCDDCKGTGKLQLTPRHALQRLGTEWGRALHENIWAEMGVRRAKALLASAQVPEYDRRVVVITDCRFMNEAKTIREAGGLVWKIDRPPGNMPPVKRTWEAHVSESFVDSPELNALVDGVIYNTGGLGYLESSVRVACNKEFPP